MLIIRFMAKSVAVNVNDIHSVTDFQRNAKTHVARLKKTGAPMILTVNGSATLVVQDANAYQEDMDRLAQLEEERFVAAVNEGIADMKAGRMIPLEKARARMERKFGIRR
jgi:PHD/YefM family antitoxin component YafN of YafNO toxin-antitoxin module